MISVYLVIGPIVDDPKLEYLYAMAFMVAGAVVYIPFVHFRYVLPGMGEHSEQLNGYGPEGCGYTVLVSFLVLDFLAFKVM